MSTFFSAFNTTLLLFTFLLIGYVLKKRELLPASADMVLSRLENMIFVPAVVISTSITRFTAENIQAKGSYILVSVLVAAILLPVSYLVGRMLGRKKARDFNYVNHSSNAGNTASEVNTTNTDNAGNVGNAASAVNTASTDNAGNVGNAASTDNVGNVGNVANTDNTEERIFRYSAMIPNFSFFGIPLVRGTLGEEALFDYLIFCLPMYLICYSIGVVWLIPSKEGSRVTIRSFFNPICISLLIGIILGLCKVRLPGFLDTALSQASGCMGPVAMILTGFVVAGYGIRNLLGDRRVYIMTALRLLVIPFVITTLLRTFLKDSPVLLYVLCFLAMPLGLNTIVIPAAYGGDTRIGASCALISSVLAVITIPFLFLVFGF